MQYKQHSNPFFPSNKLILEYAKSEEVQTRKIGFFGERRNASKETKNVTKKESLQVTEQPKSGDGRPAMAIHNDKDSIALLNKYKEPEIDSFKIFEIQDRLNKEINKARCKSSQPKLNVKLKGNKKSPIQHTSRKVKSSQPASKKEPVVATVLAGSSKLKLDSNRVSSEKSKTTTCLATGRSVSKKSTSRGKMNQSKQTNVNSSSLTAINMKSNGIGGADFNYLRERLIKRPQQPAQKSTSKGASSRGNPSGFNFLQKVALEAKHSFAGDHLNPLTNRTGSKPNVGPGEISRDRKCTSKTKSNAAGLSSTTFNIISDFSKSGNRKDRNAFKKLENPSIRTRPLESDRTPLTLLSQQIKSTLHSNLRSKKTT